MFENELRNEKNEGQAELLWVKAPVWESGADPGSGHSPGSREGEY